MKVCISRNTEARTNAAIARVTDALYKEVDSVCILSRNRFSEKERGIKKKQYYIGDNTVDNYEINIKSTPGKGLINIFQLLFFQIRAFFWFFGNREKYDLIHAFDLDVGLPALLISKITKKKYVYHIADFYTDSHSNLPDKIKSLVKKLEFKVINNAIATIICTEERIKQIEGSKPKNLTVIHNTPIFTEKILDNTLNDLETDKSKEEIIFTYVGTLSKSRFIESAIEVIKDYPQIVLNIAGVGKLTNHVESMSKRYSNIKYYGMVDYNEAFKIYSKTDFMFAIYDPEIPNNRFSAPNKVYEAMMLGKPIVVAKNTGIDTIIIDNNMGFVIDFSKEAFKELLDKIMNKSTDWKVTGANAKLAYDKYSWVTMKKRLVELYRYINSNRK